MNNQEALVFAKKRLDRISYLIEMSDSLPCRSFYEKQQDMLICAVSAMQEKAEREKGCEKCKGLVHGGNADGETLRELETRAAICAGYFCPNCGRDLRKR